MADNVKIIAAWDNDERVVKIAADHGISIPRVYQIVAARDKEPGNKGGRPRKVEPADVIAAVADGTKPIEVARALNISRGRVSQILSAHAPALVEKLRAEREANIGKRTVKERALRARQQITPPPPPPPKPKPTPADQRARPADWKAATLKAVRRSKNQQEAAKKLGLSVTGLRKRLRAIKAGD